MHDEVGPQLERALVGGRGERVVDRDEGAPPPGDDTGDIDHVELGIGRTLDPDQSRVITDGTFERAEVGLIDQVVLEPPAGHDLVDQPEGAAIQIAGEHDVEPA